jgi:hypothetical protein
MDSALQVIERLLAPGHAGRTALPRCLLQRARYYLASPRPRLGWVQPRIDAGVDPALADGADAATVRVVLQKLAPK